MCVHTPWSVRESPSKAKRRFELGEGCTWLRARRGLREPRRCRRPHMSYTLQKAAPESHICCAFCICTYVGHVVEESYCCRPIPCQICCTRKGVSDPLDEQIMCTHHRFKEPSLDEPILSSPPRRTIASQRLFSVGQREGGLPSRIR